MCKSKNMNSRLFRWFLCLQEFEFTVEHIKGENNFTDFLSRSFEVNNIKGATEEKILAYPYPEDRQRITEHYHLETGHGRAEVVQYHLAQRYYWREMIREIKEIISKCEACQRCANKIKQKTCYPCRIREINYRWEIDLIGPMDKGGYILTVIDMFSKFAASRIIRD